MLGEPKAPRLSTEKLHLPFFLNLAPELQEGILNHLGETGTAWCTGTTLHINGVLFERVGTRADTIFVALNSHLGFTLGFVKEV